MKALVVGGAGYIGSALVCALRGRGIETDYTTRQTLDLLAPIQARPGFDIVYICAAITRFIDCERNRSVAYRTNVDGPLRVAKAFLPAAIVFLSSEAAETAGNTEYGAFKRTAELNLRTVCDPIIVRLADVRKYGLDECCDYLVGLAFNGEPGEVYYWPNQIPNIFLGVHSMAA